MLGCRKKVPGVTAGCGKRGRPPPDCIVGGSPRILGTREIDSGAREREIAESGRGKFSLVQFPGLPETKLPPTTFCNLVRPCARIHFPSSRNPRGSSSDAIWRLSFPLCAPRRGGAPFQNQLLEGGGSFLPGRPELAGPEMAREWPEKS